VKLASVVDTSKRVAATSKRSEKVGILATLLATVPAGEIDAVVGLLVGEPRQGRFGVGWATLANIHTEPACESSLTIHEFDDALTTVASISGVGSQGDRAVVMAALLQRATADEQQYIRRVLTGELRQGANEGVVADAVARASGAPLDEVRRAAMLLGDLAPAARRALTGQSLADIGLQSLVGVQPMLATTSASIAEALAAVGRSSVEWKLDGARVQVHRAGGQVRVFTRNLNEISDRVPEIVQVALALPSDEFVLDGEAIGLDATGSPLKFQDTMHADTQLVPFFFDVLQHDGRSLIDMSLVDRKAVLGELVPDRYRLPSIDTDDVGAATPFAVDAVARGHEGVMVKALDSLYQAGRRGATWRKVKPVHTLDLVVLAAEWGHGRRTGWLSNLHLGARGADGEFVMVGKTFKGLTDDLLRWQTDELQRLALATDGHVVHVRPELVVEIALDGVQRSTRYPGGVALRFARVRRYRADKRADEADTIEGVQALLSTGPE